MIDDALVRRFNRGDEAAFIDIVGRHRVRIHSLAARCLRNEADAEEIAQDTFIRAHKGLARFRGEASLATWLHRIAFNLARNRYWYFFRRRRHMTLSLDCALGPDSGATFADLLPTTEANPAQHATRNEFIALIATCMTKLDVGHREILTMRNGLNHSYDQIARSLGLNPGTVKSRIARAREQLRGLMLEGCPEFPRDTSMNNWLEPVREVNRMVSARR